MPFQNAEERREYHRKWRENNREKCRAYSKKWYAQNQEKEKARSKVRYKARHEYFVEYRANNKYSQLECQRKRRGIPAPTRPMPDCCECCGKPWVDRVLHIDHCHNTGIFRGWLCVNCNMGIGQLNDSIGGLARAIEYLKRANK